MIHNEAGEVARLEGDLDAARAHYARAVARLGPRDARGVIPRCNLAIVRHALGDHSEPLDDVLDEARRVGRADIEAVLHALGMARAAKAGDPAAFDRHTRTAWLRISETRLREPDIAVLAREAAASWLPDDPARAARAADLAFAQGAQELDGLIADLRASGAPAPVGRFLAGAPLGRGGMGVVLDAVDADGGPAALKVLRA